MRKLSCRVRAAEDEGGVERVGAVRHGLFEPAVDTESSEGAGEVAGGPGDPELAGRTEFDGGLSGDQQVGVGRVRPTAAAVFEPVMDDTADEITEQADVAADADAPVPVIDIVQSHRMKAVPGRSPSTLTGAAVASWPTGWTTG
ncbi:hypothetical protein [Streptomyces sp. URMC 129]|uniref:hypothetical protein n=1 Tax=Streptomyces sp. URMC 129 TaxID=3423407 RepID=UPI003F1CD126